MHRPATIAGCILVTALGACDDQSASINKIGLNAVEIAENTIRIFGDLCVDGMPAMDGLKDRFAEVVESEFGKAPSLNRDVYGVATHAYSGIQIARGTPGWRDFEGEFRCEVSANAISTEEAGTKLAEDFEARTQGAYTLSEAQPDGPSERQAWTVSGAKPGMRLEVASGPAATGGTRLTHLRLVWRE
ncbi:MAG: hypothetical protein AAGA26_02325 [Pseudomonadota bacterium]